MEKRGQCTRQAVHKRKTKINRELTARLTGERDHASHRRTGETVQMAQTRVGSFVESVANIAVGFGINFTANLIVLPWFGFDVTPSDAFGIGLVFTVISLARSFILRRYFTGLRFGNLPEGIGRAAGREKGWRYG